MKKYEFTGETKVLPNCIKLYRIRAVRDFGYVKAGDLGGWIESENNLSHDGDCWVYDEAKVYNNAKIIGNAKIIENAKVNSNAKIYENAFVYGNALVGGNAEVYGYAKVRNSMITGKSKIYGKAIIARHAIVSEYAEVCGYARVYEYAEIRDQSIVCGNVQVYGNAKIYGDAIIKSDRDYLVFKNFWSSGRYFTWTKSNNMWKVGCFYGTGEELIEKAYKDDEESGREYERVVKYVESINR